ncbi:type II and III secretion system protein family protein [Novosphingobium flavum]|uniref:Type II and III secretion system protein family protein n=2 Tax=Novosphingobium flavum TaxID=1778672 RepID=A0A7X1FSZ6_9SPHN|nr:type II and III secretion system protein family protein [Novosphingobium flavum]
MAAGSLLALGAASASAQPYAGGPAQLDAGTLEVPMRKSKVVSADRPIAKAMVGSEEIADILPLTDRAIYVLGKKMGTTSLTLYDSAGRVMSIMNVAVGPDTESLQTQFRELIPDQQIRAAVSNDSIVLTGLVSNASAADRAVQLARTYAGDKVVNLIAIGASQQVMLEVRFAEVNRTAGRQIGFNGFGTSRGGSFSAITGPGSGWQAGSPGTTSVDGNGNVTVSGATPDVLTTTGITGAFGVFRNTFNIGSVTLDAMLNALETRGMAKTLAQPTLVALSGERASFLAGGEYPVPVAQAGGSGTAGNGTAAITVQFKQFGVSLGFTPTVLGDKTINLLVEPEVSEIDPSASLTLNGITIPGIRTRRASTTVELRDGESFALAGLLQNDFKTNVQQLPLLGSIPILGALFRSTQFQKGATELMIVVTPHLVAPIRPGQVVLPTDRVKDPNELKTFLLGQPFEANPSPPPPATPPSGAANAAPPPAPGAKKDDGYAF